MFPPDYRNKNATTTNATPSDTSTDVELRLSAPLNILPSSSKGLPPPLWSSAVACCARSEEFVDVGSFVLVAVVGSSTLVVGAKLCSSVSEEAFVVPLKAGVRVRVGEDTGGALDVSTSKLVLCTFELASVSLVGVVSVVLVGLGVGFGVGLGVLEGSGAALLLPPPLDAAFGHICSGPTFARKATTKFCPVTPCPPHASFMGPTMACSAFTHVSVQDCVVKSGMPQPEICDE